MLGIFFKGFQDKNGPYPKRTSETNSQGTRAVQYGGRGGVGSPHHMVVHPQQGQSTGFGHLSQQEHII